MATILNDLNNYWMWYGHFSLYFCFCARSKVAVTDLFTAETYFSSIPHLPV